MPKRTCDSDPTIFTTRLDPTVALIEDREMRFISRRKFQHAQNRDLTMPIFRGDEEAALDAIERKLATKRTAA